MILAAIFVGCLAFKSSLAFPQPLNIAHSPSSSLKVLKSKVKLVPAQNTDKDPVYGILSLVETSEGVYIQVRLLSLLFSTVTNFCRNDELSLTMSWLFTNRFSATRYMKVKRTGITEILRRILLFSANKTKSSESVGKQQTQLIVKLNSSLRQKLNT